MPTVVMGQATIKLKTGNIQPAANLESFISDPKLQDSEVFENTFFRLITFNEVPSPEMRSALENGGIKLYNYLPDLTYMAGIKVGADLATLRNSNIHSVIEFNPLWKLNKDLFAGQYPAWSLTQAGKVDLVVRYHKGLNADAVIEALLNQGATLIRRYDYGNWVEIRVNEGSHVDIASLPFVNGMEPIAPPSVPDDEKGRTLHRSNVINSDSPMGRHYDGTGVSVALADDGPVGPHIDYQGRIDQSNTTANSGTHGDMTAGILMGAGNLNPTIRGMGTGAFIYIYDIGGYNHVLNSPITNQTLGVMVTSTSYSQGCNDYSTDTQTGDQILNQNPTLMHVYSGGNNGTGNCNYGAGSGWGNITGGYKQG
ncbi:MAG: S8 family serine peptidase, partial [Bacteroidota bacterium]